MPRMTDGVDRSDESDIPPSMIPGGPGPFSSKELVAHWNRSSDFVRDHSKPSASPGLKPVYLFGREMRVPREAVIAYPRATIVTSDDLP